jgi:hypothetical protein
MRRQNASTCALVISIIDSRDVLSGSISEGEFLEIRPARRLGFMT